MKVRKSFGVFSQIIIVLTFFAGMFMNYALIHPVYINEETGRIVGELNSYCSYYLRNIRRSDFSSQTLARLYSESGEIDPFHGHFLIIGSEDQILFDSNGNSGDGIHLLDSVYGDKALFVINLDKKEPHNEGQIIYDKTTRMLYFARYDAGLDMVMFYGLDYFSTAIKGIQRFYLLLLIMLGGGILIISICFINMRLMARKAVRELTNQRDLDTAASIQQAMLPRGRRHLMQLDIDARLIPALKVGGDLYYYYLQNGLLYFCIGDVSGKGVTASLYMSRAVTLFRNMAQSGKTAAEIATGLNEELCLNNDQNIFLTAFIGILGVYDGHLTYCNAGHDEPLYWDGSNESEVVFLKTSTNLPLGFDTTSKYTEGSMNIGNGAMLMLYTDGITEARSKKSELYGNKRFLSLMERVRNQSAQQINDALIADVKKFATEAEQSDDITVFAMRNIDRPKVLSIVNDIKELKKLSPYVEEIFRECPLDGKTRVLVRSGLDEAVTNCVRYAYDKPEGKIELTTELSGNVLRFKLVDWGREFNPLTYVAPPTDSIRIGGLGIQMMKSSFDTIDYQRIDDQNILKMTKKL